MLLYARHTPGFRAPPRRAEIPPLPLPEMYRWICGQPTSAPVCKDARLEKAELTARSIQGAADPMKAAQPVITTIKDAIDAYVADEKGRNLSKETTKQSKTLFQKQLLPWAKRSGLDGCAISRPLSWSISARLGETTA